MNRVKNKVAIVTGGSNGIGRSACLLLAKEGAKVAVTDILDQDGEEVAKEIQKKDGIGRFWHLDVSKEKEVERVFAEIAKEFGSIDVLVNNAGITGANKPTHELGEEEWDRVFTVDVKGVFFCTKHAIPYLKKAGRGSIINISSIYGLIGAGDIPAYHASKGAVTLMSKNDALLYAKDKIRVNSIHPGAIMTTLLKDFLKTFPEGYEASLGKLVTAHAVGHAGEPDDIGYGILYLASEESKFVTGSQLVIDGGFTAQ